MKMCAKDNKIIQVKLKGTGYAVQVFNWGEEEGKENNIEYIFKAIRNHMFHLISHIIYIYISTYISI